MENIQNRSIGDMSPEEIQEIFAVGEKTEVERIEGALAYLHKGYAVMPVGSDKKPLIPAWKEYQTRLPTETEVREWWRNNPNANIALICGWKGIAVLDIDDLELAQRLHADPAIQKAPLVRSPSGGLHIYLREENASRSGQLIEGVADFKAHGGYVLAPPSAGYCHVNNVRCPLVLPDAREWAERILAIHGVEVPSKDVVSSQTTLSGKITEGSRNNVLTKMAGAWRRRGLGEETLFEALRTVNLRECEPPLPEKEVRQIARSIARYEPKKSWAARNQERLVERCLAVVKASDVEPQKICWLWHSRIALGKLSLLVGNPGQGKSYASCAIAASVTLGASLPGHTGETVRGDVLMFAVEDGIADTIRPRLDIVGADVTRVHVVTGVEEGGKEKHFSLETDIELIESKVQQGNFKLIILDPINAYLGSRIDSYKDSEIRSVLAPLAAMAERNGVAVLCVMHLNKSQGTNVLHRILGSVGYVGLARTVLFVGEHPANYQERIIDCVKSNVGEIPPPIAFEIDSGRFVWVGETDARASDVLGAQGDSAPQSRVDEAKHFLLEELADGPRGQKEIMKAAKDASISQRSLERAKGKLKVESRFVREEKQRYWVWELPNNPKNAKGEQLAFLEREDQKVIPLNQPQQPPHSE